jgi:hypothetical protein
MTNEKLDQGNVLILKIKDLKNHLEVLKTKNEDAYEGEKARINVESNFETTSRTLIQEFIPISISKFMTMYFTKLEKEIKNLEKEFEKL